jgi:hypothetical protein
MRLSGDVEHGIVNGVDQTVYNTYNLSRQPARNRAFVTTQKRAKREDREKEKRKMREISCSLSPFFSFRPASHVLRMIERLR